MRPFWERAHENEPSLVGTNVFDGLLHHARIGVVVAPRLYLLQHDDDYDSALQRLLGHVLLLDQQRLCAAMPAESMPRRRRVLRLDLCADVLSGLWPMRSVMLEWLAFALLQLWGLPLLLVSAEHVLSSRRLLPARAEHGTQRTAAASSRLSSLVMWSSRHIPTRKRKQRPCVAYACSYLNRHHGFWRRIASPKGPSASTCPATVARFGRGSDSNLLLRRHT
jgi:hypothetical protein